ncbi:uncharacterized protein LOC144479634 [Mustelus asterias]
MMARKIVGIVYLCLCVGIAYSQNSATTPFQSTTAENNNLTTGPTTNSMTQTSSEIPRSNMTGAANVTNSNATEVPNLTTDIATVTSNVMSTVPLSGSENTTTAPSGASGTQATTANQTSIVASTSSPTGTLPTQAPTTENSTVTPTLSATVPALVTNKTITQLTSVAVVPKHQTLGAGLITLIVILVLILIFGVLITAVKYSNQGKPEFKRLQELPMNSLSEEAPFAQYPPK